MRMKKHKYCRMDAPALRWELLGNAARKGIPAQTTAQLLIPAHPYTAKGSPSSKACGEPRSSRRTCERVSKSEARLRRCERVSILGRAKGARTGLSTERACSFANYETTRTRLCSAPLLLRTDSMRLSMLGRVTCAYRPSVVPIEACPSMARTTCGGMPSSRASVAAVCRSAWKLIGRMPARRRSCQRGDSTIASPSKRTFGSTEGEGIVIAFR